MSELDKNIVGIAMTSLVSSLLVFSLAFVAGSYFMCVSYHICLFEPGRFL